MNIHVHFKQGRNLLRVNKMTLEQLTDWMIGKYPTEKVLLVKHQLEDGEHVRIDMPNKQAHVLIKPLIDQ